MSFPDLVVVLMLLASRVLRRLPFIVHLQQRSALSLLIQGCEVGLTDKTLKISLAATGQTWFSRNEDESSSLKIVVDVEPRNRACLEPAVPLISDSWHTGLSLVCLPVSISYKLLFN